MKVTMGTGKVVPSFFHNCFLATTYIDAFLGGFYVIDQWRM